MSVFYFAKNPDTHGRVDTVIRNILCKRKKESEMAVQKIREEQGNIRYEYFYPVEDEETVLLIDCWENQEAYPG